MEIQSFAASILYQPDLAAKFTEPGQPQDLAPGPSRSRPDQPARVAALRLGSGRRPPPFPTAAALVDPAARGAALHFFANHELLALELMALALLRFVDAPKAFRLGLVATMRDEQRHLRLYLDRMAALGLRFGDHGVSAFFWDALKDAPTPAAFMAGMGLTLEQANLDFAGHFARAFADVGDAETAAVLRAVRDDEIGHVRQGRQWFDTLSGAHGAEGEATLYARWSAALAPPLSPARARGLDFDVGARRAAGLPEGFIRQVRLARRSKGRPAVVHVLDPTCELRVAQAQAKPGRALPAAAQAVAADLETLPVAWAGEDDVVLVRRAPPLALQERWLDAGLAVPEWVAAPEWLASSAGALPMDHPLRGRDLGDLAPWGWDPDTARRLAPLLSQVVVPAADAAGQTAASLAGHGALFRKDRWVPLAAAVGEGTLGAGAPLLPLPPVVASGRREARAAVARVHASGWPAVLKAPLGTAGRGALRLPARADSAGWTRQETAWLDRVLGAQGAVVIAPWLDRVADLSALLHVGRGGDVRVRGVTRFLTDARGQYLGTVLGRGSWGLPPDVQAYWHGGGDKRASLAARMGPVAEAVGATLAAAGYAGPAGVDALVWRAPAGELRLAPLLEVNPRRTLGHVALALEARLAPGRSGLLLLLGKPALARLGAATFAAALAQLAAGAAVSLHRGRLSAGVVPLADPATARQVLPVWVAAESGAALATLTEGLGLPWGGCERLPLLSSANRPS